VVDLTYVNPGPPTTYRMRIASFNREKGWHVLDSEGLSEWDGEVFTDEVFLAEFFADGQLRFVGAGDPPAPPPEPPRKRRRPGGAA